MALPKIDLPIFELELPSTGEKIKYRPFTVKEEKILLVAQEAEEVAQEVLAVRQIVNNCLIDIDIGTLAMFDLEYVMLVLRSRSVDNNIEFTIKDPDTDETVKLNLDVEKVQVTRYPEHSNEIRLNEEWVLYLKYPTIDEYVKMADLDPSDPLANYYMMVSCMDKIASEDEVHNFAEYKTEEVDAFVENFAGQVVKGISLFFETVPKLRHEIKYTNEKGDDKTFVIEGMKTFFS
jgi:hypothetical protein